MKSKSGHFSPNANGKIISNNASFKNASRANRNTKRFMDRTNFSGVDETQMLSSKNSINGANR